MIILKDECTVLKSLAAKLNDSTYLLATLQYHTEKNDFGKCDRSKSKYRWLARVMTTKELDEWITAMELDENRLNKWRWPNDPDPWYVVIDDGTSYKAANWLRNKRKKLMSFEDALKKFDGWQNCKKAYNSGALWDTEDYRTESGDIVSLKDKDSLLKYVGQNLYKEMILKSRLPRVMPKKPVPVNQPA